MEKEKKISEVNKRFGRNLSILRKRNRYTIRQLAEILGCSQNSIWLYETGKRAPNFEKLLQIANFFSVSTDTLLKSDVDDDLSQIKDVPSALILNGQRYDFQFDRAAFDKAQKPFTITIKYDDGLPEKNNVEQ